MSVILGSARIDENGHAHGGSSGDQKQGSTPDYKGEVSMQSFYVHSKGWIVARLKKDSWANKCAKAMKTACNNANIGYDQYQRYGLAPGKEDVDTKKKVETDCSALVRRCIYDATGKDVGDIRTITMEDALKKSGLFQDLKQYKDGMTLYTGDVLFTGHLGHPVSGHTVVVVSGKDRSDGDDGKAKIDIAKPVLKAGNVNPEVKVLQKDLNFAKAKDENGNKLEIDGEYGRHTRASVMNFQKSHKPLEVDGIYGQKTASKMDQVLNG
jgi:hypothetical protein